MKMNKIWMVACMAATLIGGVYGCDDDKDFSYEGQLDLNLLNLTQARKEAFMQNMTVRNYFRSPIIIYLLRH